jgi:hypothetical protein
LGLLVVVLAIGVLVLRGRKDDVATAEEPAPTSASTATTPPRPRTPVAARPSARADAGSKPKPLEYMADGIPIMPAGPNDPHPDGPVHPHPITPEHRRLYRENALISGLHDAMDAGDAAAMRRLLKEYKAEYPEDDQKLQSGFELLADCLPHPSAETRTRAQRYWEEERASTVRRYVRRLCLEGKP